MSTATEMSLKDLELSALAYASEIDSDFLKDEIMEDPQHERELKAVLASKSYTSLSEKQKREFVDSLWCETEEGDDQPFHDENFYDSAEHLRNFRYHHLDLPESA